MQEEPFLSDSNDFNSHLSDPQVSSTRESAITWTASEYIAHHKTSKWYISLGVTAVVVAVVVWFLTKDKVSAAVVLVAAIALGVYGSRPPQELSYSLDHENLSVGPKSYPLQDFKSFSVDDNQAFSSINLIPLKRFGLGLTIYFSPEDEATIIDLMSSVLPMEPHQSDMIDKLMHRIRF